MTTYVITLEPDEILSKRIKDIKTEAETLVGTQLYLKDEPHLTLYMGDFENITKWNKDFEQIIRKIKEDIGKIKIGISGWIIFKDDIVTEKHTLACKIDKRYLTLLKKIQKQVIDFLKQHKNQKWIKRYQNAYAKLGKVERQNLEKYGYPFISNVWEPHFTIASFEKKAFDNVWAKLKNLCPKGSYDIISLNIYALEIEDDSMELIRRYSLVNTGLLRN